MTTVAANSFDDIETERLLLRLVPPAFVEAGLAGDLAACAELIGAGVPTDLVEGPTVMESTVSSLRFRPTTSPRSG